MNPNNDAILFNQSPEQLRRIGARGGKACARNRRARQEASPAASRTIPVPVAPLESTAQALATLDAQFPWLCGAEARGFRTEF